MNYRKMMILCCMVLMGTLAAMADDLPPTINPEATFINYKGEEEVGTEHSGSAPIIGKFRANAENVGSYNAYYEWRFTLEGEAEPYLIRYEEDTEYTFTKAGSHSIVLYAVFTQGKDTIAYTDEYWGLEQMPLKVIVSESKLDMPNAFSPNGDNYNDIYKAKDGWQSIVEFHASIYNRWGQKLYEWDDPAEGWDGKFHGSDVKQGVYFVEVKAKGADGRKYHIRRDVNLLRGYRENEGSSGGGGGGE